MAALQDRDPVVTDDELDEDVGEIAYSLDQYYRRRRPLGLGDVPPGLDGALRAIFEDLGEPGPDDAAPTSRWRPPRR